MTCFEKQVGKTLGQEHSNGNWEENDERDVKGGYWRGKSWVMRILEGGKRNK